MESQTKDLSSQLSSAHIEIKTLQTKLAAARNVSTAVDGIGSKGPGSAVKGTGVNRPLVASAETALAAQLKEDLYSDLTGLIIRDVKKRESDHVYDCIQTGINGSRFINYNQLLFSSYTDSTQPSISSWQYPMMRTARLQAVSMLQSFTTYRFLILIGIGNS